MSDLMSNIKKLREITGAGFLDCKKVLEENNNDIDSSVNSLRKKGLAKANKKSSREANEGAVGLYSNENVISIIQINTETDFAAKNEIFLNFMDEIGNYSLQTNDINISTNDFSSMVFEGSSIADRFTEIIAKIGENIVLSKLVLTKITPGSMISSYIHNAYRKNIGKIAVSMISNVNNIDTEAELLGKNICMHIAASKPLSKKIEELDKKLIEKEKEIQTESIKSTGKPDSIVEKILEGKMKKFYSESVLMNQIYVLDNEKTINDVITFFSKNNKFEIINYNLVVLGD